MNGIIMDLDLNDGKLEILVMRTSNYAQDITAVTGKIAKMNRPCFVTLNRPYRALVKSFEGMGIDTKKIFFIDGITRTAVPEEKAKNCIFVDAPNSLTRLSLSISETIKTLKPEVILFDSLSTLLIYEKLGRVERFAHKLTSEFRLNKICAVFAIFRGDEETELIEYLKEFTDNVVYL